MLRTLPLSSRVFECEREILFWFDGYFSAWMLALSEEYTYLNSIVSFLLKTESSTLTISLSLLTAKAELRSLSMKLRRCLTRINTALKVYGIQIPMLKTIFKNESVDFFRIKDGKISPLIDYIDDFTFLYSDLG